MNLAATRHNSSQLSVVLTTDPTDIKFVEHVKASFSLKADTGPAGSIEFFPSGTHKIVAEKEGRAFETTVHIDQSLVERLNKILFASLADARQGKASRPYIDFGHEAKEAAAIPKRFFWSNGVRLEVEWTEAGRTKIEGRAYSYFSPTFYADESGNVTGIPSVGPIGGLVNTPAFQTIERLAAHKMEASKDSKKTEGHTMSQSIGIYELAQLAAAKSSHILALIEAGKLDPDIKFKGYLSRHTEFRFDVANLERTLNKVFSNLPKLNPFIEDGDTSKATARCRLLRSYPKLAAKLQIAALQ